MSEPDVIIRKEGRIGRMTLNRPKAMNALTLDMVRLMAPALTAFANDPDIIAVVLDGAGERGLCAGGDIRALYDAIKSGEMSGPEIFWREEYYLNAQIARFPKPYVAFMDGVVMGGGVGVSAHGNVRIVTEKTMIAMPETSIGFFPDVGGTYLLAHSPGELGTHLALTSGRVHAADAILTGLADVHVASDRWPAMLAEFAKADTAEDVQAIVRNNASAPAEGKLAQARGWIDRCYAHDSVEAILAALRAAPEAEAQKAAETIAANSPTALKVTLHALRSDRAEARLEPCLDEEYRMALRLCVAGDFVEGIRAAVVDKDRKPKWKPARLEDVTHDDIAHIFESLGANELGLAKTV